MLLLLVFQILLITFCEMQKSTVILYDMILDAISTCAQMLTWVSLIYHTEPATGKWKTEKLQSKKRICSEVNSPGNPWSQSWRRKGRLRWEWFAEKGGFKPGMKEWGGWWNTNNNKYKCQQHNEILVCFEWSDHIDMQLSVRQSGTVAAADFLVTNFTFYDCSVHTSYVCILYYNKQKQTRLTALVWDYPGEPVPER